jgi:hypothetical protein
MRCPDCKHDQKYKDGARCGKCGYQFVFRKKDDRISDSSLRQIIQRLSDNGQYAFTATQLALEICRSWRGKRQLIGGVIFVMVIALGLFFVIPLGNQRHCARCRGALRHWDEPVAKNRVTFSQGSRAY